MKKLFILSLLFVALPVYAAPFDTTGNVLGPNDFIGSTNGQALMIKTGNAKRASFGVDGMRMYKNSSGMSAIQNDNGQFIMLHVLPADCTAFYSSLQNPVFQTFSMCADGFKFTGAPLIANSNYTIAPNTAYTLTATDETVEMESGDFILPDATPTNKGKKYELINTGGGQIPVQSNSGQMIGNNIQEAQYIIMPGGSVVLKSNGLTWRIVANKV